ncbi:histidine phosphatase family protein [Microbulbifer salipaludis]|uniref:Histidine phosphatase family protein n=1 Tax=Microbulbifer salipaludis TaxID=187980 RepID=A0ABS3E8B6_9GAMM|nr:histidine phosphatase family protein [Microbulbifer salipaludis]MBN8431558.1 histidine phosphatase family protein [Microbulbifer salipaludis]
MRIDLLRHGACVGGHIFRGHVDVPLSDAGWEQMETGLLIFTAPWTRIISSPLQRCHKFAAQVGRDRGLPVHTEAGIREIGFGDWERQPVDRIWHEQRALCEAWSRDPERHSPPGGEPFASFRTRVLASIDGLAKRYGDEPLLLVTHGGVIKLLLTTAHQWQPARMIALTVGYGFGASLEYNPSTRKFSILHPPQSAYVYPA